MHDGSVPGGGLLRSPLGSELPLGKDPGTTLGEIYRPVEAELDLVAKRVSLLASAGHPLLREATATLADRPGKLVRPALLLLGSLTTGTIAPGNPSTKRGRRLRDRLVAAASSLELLHLASLTHDDILDRAPLRRGLPSAWGRHGTALALLAGDHLYGKALAQASTAGRRSCQSFCRLVDTLVAGQLLELGASGRPLSRRAYMTMVTAKTATFCSEASGLGALLAHAESRFTQALRRFGRFLGQAYQLTDDLLDWRGSPDEMGKHRFHDLSAGNLTFPVLAGLARRPARVGRAVARVTGTAPGAAGELGSLLAVLGQELEEAGAFEETSLRIRKATSLAVGSLAVLPRGVPRDNLERLAGFVVERRT